MNKKIFFYKKGKIVEVTKWDIFCITIKSYLTRFKVIDSWKYKTILHDDMKKDAAFILICLSVLLLLTPFLISDIKKEYQPDEIKEIRISSCSGYLSPYYSYSWDFERYTYTFSVSNSGSSDIEESEETESFSAEDAARMIDACNQYGAFYWKESYGEEGTCEAGKSFSIIFRDGTICRTAIGSGDAKPPNYDEVHMALFQFKYDSKSENE